MRAHVRVCISQECILTVILVNCLFTMEARAASDSLCLTFWAVSTSFVNVKYPLTKITRKGRKELLQNVNFF